MPTGNLYRGRRERLLKLRGRHLPSFGRPVGLHELPDQHLPEHHGRLGPIKLRQLRRGPLLDGRHDCLYELCHRPVLRGRGFVLKLRGGRLCFYEWCDRVLSLQLRHLLKRGRVGLL